MIRQEHQSFANKLMWRSYMNPMLSSPEIQGFEKRGVSKKPGFMPQQYRNHSQPVALQRLKGSIFYPEPKFPCPVFIWRIVL